jgi:hypothetical protein
LFLVEEQLVLMGKELLLPVGVVMATLMVVQKKALLVGQ